MLKQLRECGKGNIATIFAIAALPVMVAVAGAIDYTMASSQANNVQNALDSAALAAGTVYYSGMKQTELAAYAEDHFRENLARRMNDEPSFRYRVLSGSAEVGLFSASFSASDPFSDFIVVESKFDYGAMVGGWMGPWPVSRMSVVRVAPATEACVLALDPTADQAFKIQGSTKVSLDGCVIAANSRSSSAIFRGGSAQLSAECAFARGATVGLDSSNADLKCGSPLHGQYPARDPLANVQPPNYTACTKVSGNSPTLKRNTTYCDERIRGKVTLESDGWYILRGGEINLGGNGSLFGRRVTIFLMEGARITLGANQTIDLTAPESGPYAGITIYQARNNTQALNLVGGSDIKITGFIYAPAADVMYAGNSDTNGLPECIRIVGRTVEMTGTSDVRSDCEKEFGGRKMQIGQFVGLVR
jgi:hypothetical protein